MAQERSAALVALGILNIVFGALALTCGCCGIVGVAALFGIGSMNLPGPPGPNPGANVNPIKDMMEFMNRELPGYQFVEIGFALGKAVVGIVLLIAGIGLLVVKDWGRWLSLTCAALILLLFPAYIVYELAFVKPATEKWTVQFFQKHGMAGQMPPKTSLNTASESAQIIGGSGLFIVYALALLILMFIPPVTAAFSKRPARPRDWDGEDRERFDRDDQGWSKGEDEGRFRRRDREE